MHLCLACTACFVGSSHSWAEVDDPQTTLEPLVIVGTRTGRQWLDAGGSVTQIDQAEMIRSGVNDLGGLVKYDPLLSTPFDVGGGDGAFAYGSSGYSGFNIRGAEGNRISIELDGIRQPPQYVSTSFDMGSDGGSGGIGRDYYDPAIFNLVEVLKGGASALYGSDALGGIVSLRTINAEDLLGDKSSGGLIRGQHFSVNEGYAAQVGGAIRVKDFDFILLYAGRIGKETKNNGSLKPNPVEFASNAWLAKASYKYDENQILFTLETYHRDTDINAISATTSDFAVFDQSVLNFQEIERFRLGLEWDLQFDQPWIDRLENHLYLQKSQTTNANESRSQNLDVGGVIVDGRRREQTIQFDTSLLGLNSILSKELSLGDFTHKLLTGIDLSREDSENRFDRIDTAQPGSRNRISFAPSSTDRYGIFIQDEVQAAERWSVTPGLRADLHAIRPDLSADYLERLAELDRNITQPPGDYNNFTLSPRLDISFKTTENTRLYAAYSRGVRNPTAEELSMVFDHPPNGANPAGSITVPNPGLKEETSHSLKAGYKGETDLCRFDIGGFYTFYKDFIEGGVLTGRQDDAGRDIVTTVNRGESEIFGFEIMNSWNIGEIFSPFEGVSLGINTGKAIGINRTDDTWLNSVEPWKTSTWIGYDDPDETYGVRLTGIYTAAVTRVDDTTNQGEFFRPPSWFTLDVSGYWKPTETCTLNVGVNNLLDEKYWTWGSVRRGNGHLGGGAADDRSTAPGTNFYISLTQTF